MADKYAKRRIDVFAGEGVAAAMAGDAAHMQSPPVSGPMSSSPQQLAPAGGRSSNARPDGIGHTRGNLHGDQFMKEKRDEKVSPNPIKARGVCNPLVDFLPNTRSRTGGVQLMPNMGGNYDDGSKNIGAAGQSSSEAWRCSHNYMAHGAEGYGDFRSEHLAMQSNAQASRSANPQARHLQTDSKVVFG